jgi:hypothetical protein
MPIDARVIDPVDRRHDEPADSEINGYYISYQS